jgi:hypothetical protein
VRLRRGEGWGLWGRRRGVGVFGCFVGGRGWIGLCVRREWLMLVRSVELLERILGLSEIE